VEYNQATAQATLYNAQGKMIVRQKYVVNVTPNAVIDCAELPLPQSASGLTLVRLQLTDKNGRTISENDYWVDAANPTKYTSLDNIGKASIAWKSVAKQSNQAATTFTVEVRNTSKCIALNLKANVRDTNGKAILPAYASDGYFHLLPGQKRRLTIEIPAKYVVEDMKVDFSGLNI
jgi:hypothetical protein